MSNFGNGAQYCCGADRCKKPTQRQDGGDANLSAGGESFILSGIDFNEGRGIRWHLVNIVAGQVRSSESQR